MTNTIIIPEAIRLQSTALHNTLLRSQFGTLKRVHDFNSSRSKFATLKRKRRINRMVSQNAIPSINYITQEQHPRERIGFKPKT